uniref:RRM domain-containing protein n=1 Tax=Scophthalmus maximus TaxID=52904 RepID=A0A8D3ATF9_SCOMX
LIKTRWINACVSSHPPLVFQAGAPSQDENPPLPSQDENPPLPSQDENPPLQHEDKNPPLQPEDENPPLQPEDENPPLQPEDENPPLQPEDENPPLQPEDEYPPLPSYQSDLEPEKELYIVQVKGLPWTTTAEDLLQFFSECRICDGRNGIHLTKNRQGKPSGRAYIEMEHESDVVRALEKHRQYLGSRYVEVYEVTNSDAEIILQKVVQAPAVCGVVRLRGLPFLSTERDIVQFFSGLDIAENGITIVTDHKGRNSGEAFVQFCSQEAAFAALQRDKEHIGRRFIEVFPSRIEEIHPHWKKKAPIDGASDPANRMFSASRTNTRTGSPLSSGEQIHYVHMRGLPFQVSLEDIVQFFSPLIVSKILVECQADGRPKGECDVYFSSHRDAAAAMSRDKQYIGERYIELFLNSTTDSDWR